MIALVALCPLPLTGCSPTKAIIKTEIVKQYPPAAWLQDCPVPKYVPGQPWEYIPSFARAQQDTIACDQCDKARLRAWVANEKIPECSFK